MLKEEEIIELLTKQNLSESERGKLLEELRSNPDLIGFDRIVRTLTDLAKDEHVDTDLLSEYVLFLNGDKSNESKLTLLIPGIEKHLQSCSKCREEFEFLSSELNEVDNFLSKNIGVEEKPETVKTKGPNIFRLFENFNAKYSYAAAASIMIMFLSLFAISEFSTPDYVKLSSNHSYDDFSSTRGRTSVHFMNAVTALENKNYNSAISELQKDIESSSDDLTTFYSYYVLGITHLTKAHSDFVGLFDSYNKKELSAAIDNFNRSLELNNTGLFKNVNSNTYFFLGKSYLLEEKFDSAKKYLSQAIDNESEYSQEAKELLSSIK
ncbi:hypothetical protein MNBD_IGNAVI01-513 [hydrothermal vent metagenome]|uniref:Uncharacterized protein n=1 Tax=hydrothermal vent metagenome TaxID=652676 RepID=A0A3B1BZF8_9ZZZZ